MTQFVNPACGVQFCVAACASGALTRLGTAMPATPAASVAAVRAAAAITAVGRRHQRRRVDELDIEINRPSGCRVFTVFWESRDELPGMKTSQRRDRDAPSERFSEFECRLGSRVGAR